MELELAWMCGPYHLPSGGGVLDQDAALYKRMLKLNHIYHTLDRMRNLKGAEIHSMTTGERKIVKALLDGGFRLG